MLFSESLEFGADYTSIQYYQYFGLMESVLQSLREEFFVTQGDSSESGKVTLSSC